MLPSQCLNRFSTLHHQDCFLKQKKVWTRTSQTLCVVYIWVVLVIRYDSGNSGSLGVSFCCFFFIFPGMLDVREDFHLSAGTGCLFPPVFCSRCVCQLRPQPRCLEDMNTFMPISCVVSYAFGNGTSLLLKAFCLTDKRKVWEGGLCMVFSFLLFLWCVGLRKTASRH